MTIVICAGAADAAVWLPEARVEARYDGNVVRSNEPISDFVGVLAPGLRLMGGAESMPFDARVSRTLVSYASESQVEVLSDLALVRASYQGRGADSVGTDFLYRRSADPLETFDGSIGLGEYITKIDGGLRASSWRAAGDARIRDWSYDVPQLVESQSRSASLRGYAYRDRTTGAYANFRMRDLEISDNGLDLQLYTAGGERRHSELVASRVEVGGYHASFDDGSPDESGLAFALELQAERGTAADPVKLRARIADDVATTGLLEVDVVRGRFRAVTRFERLLDVEGGIYRDPNLTRRLRFVAEGSPDGMRVFRLEGGLDHARPFGNGSGPKTDTVRLGASMTFPLRMWLSARTGYDFQRQEVPDADDRDFSRHRLTFSLTARRPQ